MHEYEREETNFTWNMIKNEKARTMKSARHGGN